MTSSFEDQGTELAARRTGMSFQRTRMSADRTLMSVIRTSLSLIGFGFTVVQFFQKLRQGGTIAVPTGSIRAFGSSLVGLGIVMLILGIVYHAMFMLGLRHERSAMRSAGLIYGESAFPPSLTLIVALVLLLIGFLAAAAIFFDVGPFE